MPRQASVFDIFATQDFLNELAESSRAAEQLRTFVESTGLPVLGYVRNTQNYVQLAARGLTVFDLAPERVARDLAQWQPICEWLDQ